MLRVTVTPELFSDDKALAAYLRRLLKENPDGILLRAEATDTLGLVSQNQVE